MYEGKGYLIFVWWVMLYLLYFLGMGASPLSL